MLRDLGPINDTDSADRTKTTIVITPKDPERAVGAIQSLLDIPIVDKIIVSVTVRTGFSRVDSPRVIYRNNDVYFGIKYGIGTSYIAALDPSIITESVCFIEYLTDLPDADSLGAILNSWSQQPYAIHGIRGSHCELDLKNKKYHFVNQNGGPAMIVQRHRSIISRKVLYTILLQIAKTPIIYNILHSSTPRWNAGDIAVSFLVQHTLGYENQVHPQESVYSIEESTNPLLNTLFEMYIQRKRILPKSSDILVIIPYYNYVNSHRIYDNLVECVKTYTKQGVDVLVCEIRLPNTISHVQALPCSIISLTSPTIAFHNHTGFNIGFKELADRYEYIVQSDSDILFDDPLWTTQLKQCLETCDMVQPWSTCFWLDKGRTPMRTKISFAHMLATNQHISIEALYTAHACNVWHQGFVWAYRTDFLKRIDGLFNRAFLGGADNILTYIALGDRYKSIPHSNGMYKSLSYLQPELDEYLTRTASTGVRVGSMTGMIRHLVHGKLDKRQYASRHTIVKDEGDTIDKILEPGGPYDVVQFRNPTLNGRVLKYLEDRKDDEVE